MELIRALKPIWELLSLISNWAMLAVIILFGFIAGVLSFYHFVIDSDSDDMGKEIAYRTRLKKSAVSCLMIFVVVIIIRVVLECILSM